MEESWRETCDTMRLDLSDNPKQLMRKRRNQIRHDDKEPNCTLPSLLVAAGLGVAGILLVRQSRKLKEDGPLQRFGAAIDSMIAKIAPRRSVSTVESAKDWRRSRPADMAARAAYERAAADQTMPSASTGNANGKKKQAGQKTKKKNKKKGKKR
eukprot:jgi/Picsp_1/1980/NSC_05446-R1_---NA---